MTKTNPIEKYGTSGITVCLKCNPDATALTPPDKILKCKCRMTKTNQPDHTAKVSEKVEDWEKRFDELTRERLGELYTRTRWLEDKDYINVTGEIKDFISQERQIMKEELMNCLEYNSLAMGCRLEDQGITDRYEAMEYGFEEAEKQLLAKLEELK